MLCATSHSSGNYTVSLNLGPRARRQMVIMRNGEAAGKRDHLDRNLVSVELCYKSPRPCAGSIWHGEPRGLDLHDGARPVKTISAPAPAREAARQAPCNLAGVA